MKVRQRNGSTRFPNGDTSVGEGSRAGEAGRIDVPGKILGFWPALLMALVVLCGLVGPASVASCFGADIKLFVAKNGNDNWSGRLTEPNRELTDGPFASLERARLEIRKIKNAGAAGGNSYTVAVRAGYYQLDKTFILTEGDSGTASSNIVYTAYNNEKVTLSGGRLLASFKPYKDHIVQFDLSNVAPGLSKLGQFYYNGERQQIARWPNSTDDRRIESFAYVAGTDGGAEKRQFRYSGTIPRAYGDLKDTQLCIWHNNWSYETADVERVDYAAKTVYLKKDLAYPARPGARFFLQGAFGELDASGEWYFDGRRQVLYFYMPPTSQTLPAAVPVLDTIVSLRGASYVQLRKFTIQYSKADAVEIKNGTGDAITGCTVRNVGGTAVRISGGKNNGAAGNDIYDTGVSGIEISGGDRRTLSASQSYADNNYITKFAQERKTGGFGCLIDGVGIRLSHNVIGNSPFIGIRLYGNDHTIEYNEIYNVCEEAGDTGAIYIGRDWTYRGNVIRFNKIHDIYGFGMSRTSQPWRGVFVYERPCEAWGIYLDDCASGVQIYGNMFYRVPLCAVMIGGGRDNVMESNIIIGSVPAVVVTSRNAGIYESSLKRTLMAGLSIMRYRPSLYTTRYPELQSLVDAADKREPVNNRFRNNIVVYRDDDFSGYHTAQPKKGAAVVYMIDDATVRPGDFDNNVVWHYGLPVRVSYRSYGSVKSEVMTWDKWKAKGFDAHSTLADPGLPGPPDKESVAEAISPALNFGFDAVRLDKAGSYESPLRASWPINKKIETVGAPQIGRVTVSQ